MKNNFRILGPSQNMSGAMDVETADGRIVPVAADHPDVQAAMMSSPAAAVSEPPMPEPAMTPVPDGWNPQPPAAAPAPAPTGGRGLPAPQNNYVEPARMERVPMPPRKVESGVTYQPEAPAMAAAAAPVDPRTRIMENAQIASAAAAPRGGGGPVVRNTQTTESKSKLYSEGDIQKLGELGGQKEEAENQGLDASVDATSAEQDMYNERARLADAQAKTAEDEMARLAERRKLQETRLADFEARRVAAESDAKSAESQMLGRETSSRVIAALGMLFGGIGDAMTGGTGHAVANIQAQLNNELNRQRQEVAQKQAKPGEYVNAYHQLLSQMGDEAAASKAFLSTGNAVVEAKLNKMTAGMQSSQAQAKKQAMVAELQRQRAENGMAAIDASAPVVTNVSTVKTGSGGGGAKPAIDAEALFKALNDAKNPDEAAGLMNLGGFQMTQNLSDGERTKAREMVGGYKEYTTGLGIIRKLRDQWQNSSVATPVETQRRKAALQTAVEEVMMAKAKTTGGVVTDSDKQWAKELIGNPAAFFELTSDARMEQLRSQTQEMFTSKVSAYGLVPARGTAEQQQALAASIPGAIPRGAQ